MSYISSLNLLGDDPSIPLSEEDVTDELALWANAQFKFDSAPGSALLDDTLKPTATNDCIYGVLNDFSDFDHQRHSLVTPLPNNQHHQHASLMTMISPDSYAHTTTTSPLTTPTFDIHSADSLFANETATMEETTTRTSTTASPPSDKEEIVTAPTGTTQKIKTGMDEDKRRRNTAASARFRQKKKLREQALQETVKEMTAKTEVLEKRCQELELEAKWLRALLVEKNPSFITPLPTACSSSLKA